MEAAKASLAAVRQDKFLKFHEALMNNKDHISDSTIADAAKQAGIDLDKLKKDAADPAIEKMIEDNLQLGQDVGVRGTPMFIINGTVFPGAMQYDQMKKAVQDVRAGEKKKS
jgi:protein-disulfide isomerase